jgi:hypothetical protein
MRKLTLSLAVLMLAVAGCSKHNSTGTNYYFTYNHGAIPYRSRINDSLILVQTPNQGAAAFELYSFRTQELMDSATAGLLALSTWDLCGIYFSNQDSTRTGTYTTDTLSKRQVYNTVFRFYYKNDPQQGNYFATPGLPFSVTITAATADYIEGTFEGKLVKGVNVDTTTVSNGKFRLPRK